MARAYSYLRFSTPEQSQGDSFRRQAALAQEYAKKHHLELDEKLTFQDLGVSAYRGKNSETGQLGAFLDAVKAGLVPRGSYLLVESLDRISRQAARKALRVLELILEEDIVVVTLSDNREYTQKTLDEDPMSLMMSLFVFIRANEESMMKSRRLRSAWAGKRDRAEGELFTRRGPGWLTWDDQTNTWKVDEKRAKVVQRIFEQAISGEGLITIVKRLNEEKVPVFGRGRSWHQSYINRILHNPAVIGTNVLNTLEYKDGKRIRRPVKTIPGYFPAIVDKEIFDQVQAVRLDYVRSPFRGKNAHSAPKNIFGGLVMCSRCGGPMSMVNKGARSNRCLVCQNARYGVRCKYTAVRYGHVEKAFLEEMDRILATAPAGRTGETIDQEIDRLQAAKEALEEEAQALVVSLKRSPGSPTILQRLQDVEGELEEVRGSLGDAQEKRDVTSGPLVAKRVKELKMLLKTEPMDRRAVNTMMRTVFSALVINPDEGTGTLTWKHGGSAEFTWGFPRGSAGSKRPGKQ